MASADGDGQEGCANQLTLADCPNVAQTDITQRGKYKWQTNWNADLNDVGLEPDWQDGPEAETRWP